MENTEKKEFDWTAVQRNLERLDVDFTKNDQFIIAEILKSRAKLLAREETEEKNEEEIEVMEFKLANERYALESLFIKEVYTLKDMTFVPGAPDFIAGVINYRGQILSIIDLKKFFGLPKNEITNLNKIIVVANKEMEFGILADEIVAIQQISKNDIQTPLATMNGIKEEYILGITKESMAILSGEKILNDNKMKIS